MLPGGLSSAHCRRINAFTDDCYGYSENDECECEDIMKICLLAISGSSLKYNGVGRVVFLSDFEAKFLNTTAYLDNALVLEYLSILVLLISEEKRSTRRLVCATEDDPISTSGIVTFYQSAAKESEQTGCENKNILCSTRQTAR